MRRLRNSECWALTAKKRPQHWTELRPLGVCRWGASIMRDAGRRSTFVVGDVEAALPAGSRAINLKSWRGLLGKRKP
jgi:hypothetical protein